MEPFFYLIGGVFALVICLVILSWPKSKSKNYIPGTGKILIHVQGYEIRDLSDDKSYSAMKIIEGNRRLWSFKDVVFARTIGATKTKDFVKDGTDEYTYILECWQKTTIKK